MWRLMTLIPLFDYKPLKLQLRVFLAGHAVAMVTHCVVLFNDNNHITSSIIELHDLAEEDYRL